MASEADRTGSPSPPVARSTGAAWRRRQQQLRSWERHMQKTIILARASSTHHTGAKLNPTCIPDLQHLQDITRLQKEVSSLVQKVAFLEEALARSVCPGGRPEAQQEASAPPPRDCHAEFLHDELPECLASPCTPPRTHRRRAQAPSSPSPMSQCYADDGLARPKVRPRADVNSAHAPLHVHAQQSSYVSTQLDDYGGDDEPDAAEVNAALRGAEDMLKILDARQQLGPYNRYGWTASPWYSSSPYWKR